MSRMSLSVGSTTTYVYASYLLNLFEIPVRQGVAVGVMCSVLTPPMSGRERVSSLGSQW